MKYPFQVQRYLQSQPNPWYPCMNHPTLKQAIDHASKYSPEESIRVVDLETRFVVYERPVKESK